MTDVHRILEISGIEEVLAELVHALTHVTKALDVARKNLGEHRVTHEANIAQHAMDNTVRMVKTQLATAKK